ncbi:MAG: LPS assembly lipoprotein LptE, partial [Dechloromonas sp.]|nr:LPS assembly lipoprotein LptE [Dechloromonas sp.]
FVQLDDNRQKSILSVNAQGRVREYRLQLNYSFRLVNATGQEIVSPVDIVMTRDISFNDSQVLAKDIEENLLWRDMNNDLVNQIMRRLSLIKPKDPTATEED